MDTNYNNKIEGFQNNSKSLLVVVYDSSSNLMDITDYSGYFYMQKYPIRAGQPIDVSLAYSAKDASKGSFWFNLTKSDLDLEKGDYIFEVIIDDGSTNRYTVVQDKFNLNKSLM